jgi:acetolactate synthase-1/3 small subunit
VSTLTFVVHARRTPETLLRVVSMFHRRAIEIEKLTAEAADDPCVLCITVSLEVGTDHAERMEANLEKLVDVLLVESSESNQEHAGEVRGTEATK